ncbi:radical SAM protein [Paenibacillus yonginensis]|uniref:Radical SAM protein n=1 Tax=Paenibacillus yonginensis TaxID=1462996 RepID=A0A1B1MZZ8_9BACL|nr:radical SAM protein [Paenibacillus yonginensis]ANS74741.1 radical SAM protein [Paenibacillus yonginensis]
MAKTYEQIHAKQTLTKVKEERMPFEWSINPYRGCAHGCSFCYARGFQGFIDKQANDEFQNHILLKMNAAEALETQLSKLAVRYAHDLEAVRRHIGRVAIGTVTDPYQPVESKTRITRECLKVLAKYRIRTSITTRSPLILRDLDLLQAMDDILVNISIGSLDAKLIRLLEPGAPLPFKRLEALEALSGSGIRTGVFVAPILPLLTDDKEGLEVLFAAARKGGADFVMTSLLRLSPDVKGWYYKTLCEHFPEKLQAYRDLYQGGAYTDESYRERIRRITDELQLKYALTGDETSKVKREASSTDSRGALLSKAAALEEIAGELPVEQLSFGF